MKRSFLEAVSSKEITNFDGVTVLAYLLSRSIFYRNSLLMLLDYYESSGKYGGFTLKRWLYFVY